MAERRDSERLPLLGAFAGDVTVSQPTSILQISLGGMETETAFQLPLDSLHEFRLTLGDRSIVVKGRVVHSRIRDVDQDAVTYRSGIEFVDVPDHAARVIAEFVELLRDVRRDRR